MKAYIYARQSSGDENTSESVELQIEKCQELAFSENISVIGIAKDLNTSGKTYPTGSEQIASIDISFQSWYKEQTGHKMFRDGLGEVIKHLADIDYIIVYDITRLYRPINGSHLESHINQLLIYHNVKVMTVNNGILDVGSFNDSIITALQNRINHEHIATCRRKSIAAMNKLRDSGIYCNGGKAFGIKYIGNKQFEIEPRKAEVIRYIFEQIAQYTPYLQIIRYINKHYKDCFKNCCYESNLYHISQNPIYSGYMYNTQRELIKNIQMEGKEIISFDLWKKVQDIMAVKRKEPHKGKHNWLPFSGLLFDGYAQTKLVTRIDKGKIFYFPNIKNLDPDVKIGGSVYFNIEKKEYTGIFQAVIPILILAFKQRVEKAEKLEARKKELEKYQIELENMRKKEKDLTEKYMKGLLDSDIFEEVLLTHKQRKSELSSIIAETTSYKSIDRNSMLFAQWTEFSALINNEISQKQYEILLKETIKQIKVFENKIIVSTILGDIEIPRFLVANKKHFPKWNIELSEAENITNNKFDFRDTIIKIIYKLPTSYTGDTQLSLIRKFNNIEFYTIGKNEK
jgi:DNA invertase Pin-like site-specific DNA recombinase